MDNIIGKVFVRLIKLLLVIVVIGFVCIGWLVYNVATNDGAIKSQVKPTIDFELKANGKQIDTIWIVKGIKH